MNVNNNEDEHKNNRNIVIAFRRGGKNKSTLSRLISIMKQSRSPTHPGAIIKHDYLEPLNISVTTLADHLGVSRITVSNIVNEHSSVTPAMALRLARVFDTTPELWVGLQVTYDLWYALHVSKEWLNVKPLIISNIVSVDED